MTQQQPIFPQVGLLVLQTKIIDRFDSFILHPGGTGVVVIAEPNNIIVVRMDEPFPGGDTWDYEIQLVTDELDYPPGDDSGINTLEKLLFYYFEAIPGQTEEEIAARGKKIDEEFVAKRQKEAPIYLYEDNAGRLFIHRREDAIVYEDDPATTYAQFHEDAKSIYEGSTIDDWPDCWKSPYEEVMFKGMRHIATWWPTDKVTIHQRPGNKGQIFLGITRKEAHIGLYPWTFSVSYSTSDEEAKGRVLQRQYDEAIQSSNEPWKQKRIRNILEQALKLGFVIGYDPQISGSRILILCPKGNRATHV